MINTNKTVAILYSTLVVSTLVFSFLVVTPKAHAEVSPEELEVLQTQVDLIAEFVDDVEQIKGEVLGVSTSLPVKYFETTVIESGDKRALSPDGSWWQGGKEMQKKRILMQIETHKKQIALLEAQLKKLDEETSSSSTPSKTFTIKDIKSVTYKYVDPTAEAVDDDYTLYTIILISGKKIEVKMCGSYCKEGEREEQFRRVGFKGDMDALFDMAKKGDSTSESKPTPRFNGFTYPDKSNKVEASLVFGKSKDGSVPTVMGPVLRGTVNWGDGVTEKVHALVVEEFNKVTHTYKKTGKFTIVITNATDKKTAKKEVVIVPQVQEI